MTPSRPPPAPTAARRDLLLRDLRDRFIAGLREIGIGDEPLHLLVALSGGLDSVTLLHLLRFSPALSHHRLTAAHFDHRMRPGSADDAAWVRGLGRGWGVPVVMGVAEATLANETQARLARYRFLRATANEVGADWIVTAHHADDQAETVLFRALRGTGIRGLAGMSARSLTRILRPLLPFWREELHDYAMAAGLRWRVDPTNESRGPARNRIRLSLLPDIERHIAPSARRNLVRLAELARESEEAWREVVDSALKRVAVASPSGWSIDRVAMRDYPPALAVRVLRIMLESSGLTLSRSGTRSALQFITDAPSGRELQLPGGVRIRTEFDRATIGVDAASVQDVPLEIPSAAAAATLSGELMLGGRRFRVLGRASGSAGGGPSKAPGWRVEIPTRDVRFPLRLRGRKPGDWIRTAGGSKPLKKLMIERRVPRSERGSIPVLEDATGRILWVAGIGADRDLRSSNGDPFLDIVRDE